MMNWQRLSRHVVIAAVVMGGLAWLFLLPADPGRPLLQQFGAGVELDGPFSFSRQAGLAAYAHDSGTPGIRVLDVRNGNSVADVATKGAWPKEPVISPNGRYVAFVDTDPEAPEGHRVLYVTDRSSRDVHLIRESSSQDHLGRYLFSPDSSRLVYEFIHLAASIDVDEFRVVDLKTYSDQTLMVNGHAGMRAPAFSSDGSRLYFISGNCIVRHELESGQRSQIGCFPPGAELFPPGAGEVPVISKDESRILVTMMINGCPRVGLLEQGATEVKLLEPETCGYRPEFLGDDQSLIVYIHLPLDGNRLLRVFSAAEGRSRSLGFTEGIVYRIAVDGNRVLALGATPSSTRALRAFDAQTGEASILARGEGTGIESRLLKSFRTATIPSFDGLAIPVRIFEPACRASAQGPAVLLIHGSPRGKDDVPPRLSREIGYLLGRGITVIAPNYRGSTGHGERLGQFSGIGSQVKDLVSVTHAAQTLPEIGNSPLHALGVCYGSEYLMIGLARAAAESFRSLISWSGGGGPLLRLPPHHPEVLWIITARDGSLERINELDADRYARLRQKTTLHPIDDTHMVLHGESRLSALEAVSAFVEKKSGVQCAESFWDR